MPPGAEQVAAGAHFKIQAVLRAEVVKTKAVRATPAGIGNLVNGYPYRKRTLGKVRVAKLKQPSRANISAAQSER